MTSNNISLDFLYELIDAKKKNTISEYLIKQIHALAVKEADSEIAGIYRNGDVFISGSDHTPPSGFVVPQEMEKFIKWINQNQIIVKYISNVRVLKIVCILDRQVFL